VVLSRVAIKSDVYTAALTVWNTANDSLESISCHISYCRIPNKSRYFVNTNEITRVKI